MTALNVISIVLWTVTRLRHDVIWRSATACMQKPILFETPTEILQDWNRLVLQTVFLLPDETSPDILQIAPRTRWSP